MDVSSVFPLTAKVVRGEVKSLVCVVAVYLAVCAVTKLLQWLLGWVPILGWALRLVLWLVGIYCVIGIIVAILQYFRTTD